RRQFGRSRDREVHVDWDNSWITWVVRINLVHLVTASNEEMIDRGGQAAAFSRNIQWISEGISRAKSNRIVGENSKRVANMSDITYFGVFFDLTSGIVGLGRWSWSGIALHLSIIAFIWIIAAS